MTEGRVRAHSALWILFHSLQIVLSEVLCLHNQNYILKIPLHQYGECRRI